MTRADALITWPIEDYLALLGTRRGDLAELRTAFARLLTYPGCRADDDPLPELEQLLADLTPDHRRRPLPRLRPTARPPHGQPRAAAAVLLTVLHRPRPDAAPPRVAVSPASLPAQSLP